MSTSAAVLGDSGRSLAAGDSEAARDPLSISAEVKSSLSLLIVDDDRTLREGCASVLQMDGFNVTTLGRGDEALELVRRRKFDIVLVDLYMLSRRASSSWVPSARTRSASATNSRR